MHGDGERIASVVRGCKRLTRKGCDQKLSMQRNAKSARKMAAVASARAIASFAF